MDLHQILTRKGLKFRQHLEEEGWGIRALTVIDLTDAQAAALAKGGPHALREQLAGEGKWSFPATEIETGVAPRSDLVLAEGAKAQAVVVAPASQMPLAETFLKTIEARSGARLRLVPDDEADLSLLENHDAVLFGGSHESRFALDMALRYQSAFLDASVPGPGGWALATHCGLERSGHLIFQVACDSTAAEAAWQALEAAMESEATRLVLRPRHRIEPGPGLKKGLTTWEKVLAAAPGRLRRSEEELGEKPSDPNDIEGWAKFIRQGLESGGPDVNLYNQGPIVFATECARYYQVSADPRALRMFHALLYQLMDYYLASPEGASYPSDFDFILGHLVLYYARLEHESVFTDEDRLLLRNFLLSCSRSVNEYARAFWPKDKPGRKTNTRHNHQTFPARSLIYAYDYFNRFDIADAADFKAYADDIFSGEMWHRSKQGENAGKYEIFVYDHGAAYSGYTGRGLDLFDPDALKTAADRLTVITDNFFRDVDCGDSAVSMKPGGEETLAVLVTSQSRDDLQQWFANESLVRSRNFSLLGKAPGMGITGLRLGRKVSEPPPRRWESIPLEPRFIDDFAPGFPVGYAFDKMAYRTGWGDDDHYLMIEGVGSKNISHSHNDANGITRLNHLGRHWLVSNGYGRRVGITNVSKSFSSRVQGPDDHNMLVLHRGGEMVADLPPLCAKLQLGRNEELAWFTGALFGYGGTDWFRTVVMVPDQCVVVVDRVRIVEAGLEKAHIEWNALGAVAAVPGGFRLDQNGVSMDVASPSGWTARPDVAARSANWKSVLEGGEYPYATFPLAKLVFEAPGVEAGQTHRLVTFLSAFKEGEEGRQISQDSDGTIRVDGLREVSGGFEDADLKVSLRDGRLAIKCDTVPSVPPEFTG